LGGITGIRRAQSLNGLIDGRLQFGEYEWQVIGVSHSNKSGAQLLDAMIVVKEA